MKFQREDSLKHYSYLEEILTYIRALVPNDIENKILENLYKVLQTEFREALQLELL